MSDIRDSCTDTVFTTPPINQASYNPRHSTVSVHARYCQKQYNLKHLLTPHPFDLVSRSSFLLDLPSRHKVFKLTRVWSLAILLSKLRLWNKEAKVNQTNKRLGKFCLVPRLTSTCYVSEVVWALCWGLFTQDAPEVTGELEVRVSISNLQVSA